MILGFLVVSISKASCVFDGIFVRYERVSSNEELVIKTGLNGIDYAINVDNQRAYKILGQ